MRAFRGLVGAIAAAIVVLSLAAGAALAQAPSLAIQSPAGGSVGKDTTPSFSGTTDDPSDNLSVNVYEGATASGEPVRTLTTLVPPVTGEWSLGPASSLNDGTYTAQATQTNVLEETGLSAPVTFSVDTTRPAVSMDTVTSPTKDATPTLKGGAGTAEGDSATVTVTISSGKGVVAAESVAVEGKSWSYTPPHLSDGSYTAEVTQSDQAGNIGEGERTFTVDTTPPSVSLNVIPSPTGDSTPTLSGEGGNDPGDNSAVTVRIYSGESQVATGTPSVGSEHWSFTSPHLADGTYTAKATQTDQAGNEGTSAIRTFTVETASPTVTLKAPPSPSNDTTPSFTGTASDTEPVTVHIYKGSKAQGTQVSSAQTTGGGNWTSGNASPALSSGQYTAMATQPSSLKNPDGESNSVTFSVSTSAPTVTLDAVASLSNHTTPSFTGTATDTTTVTVEIYAGSKASGTPVSSATANGSGGNWTSGNASPALSSGEYTAAAFQESSLGNPTGKSNAVTFEVETASPAVTLNKPASPSNHTTPSFSGTASDTTTVTVRIYSGSDTSGTPVSSATAKGNGGSWSSGSASPALSSGEYTAVATQPSSLGNPEGRSATVAFEVETASPAVTLNQPTSPSNHTTPSFTGTASDTTTVTVRIYSGPHATGSPVSSATATGGATWTSGNAAPALSSGEYTAVASQPSSLGNPEGKSAAVTFEVSTASPTVTLNPIESPSNHTTPSFSGFGSDKTQVTVQIYKGTSAEGTAVASATATGSGGEWSSGQAGPALTSGQYSAVATQPSSLGNAAGRSNTIIFTVNTSPPTVTLNQPKTPSNNTAPSFTGTATDEEPVTIRIYPGPKAEGSEVSKAAATGTGGGWASGQASPALTSGQYTAIAEQPSSLGNAAGKSSAVTFVVDTTSPTVTLGEPPTPSKNTTPAFKGTATATTSVVVHIYEGTKAEGTEVSKATATGTGGSWTSSNANPALSTGLHTFTAVATQESPLGNPAGRSASVTFVVNTTPPTVTLNSPALRSNNRTPAFSGSASDTNPVTVHIYEGGKPEGTEVAKATATGSGATWTAPAVSPELASGVHNYTAIATQESSLGNSQGKSTAITFTVDTSSPTVALTQLPPSNNTTPSFAGSASETTPVTIRIYEGTKTEKEVSKATAAGTGGAWASGTASPALATGTHTYTAVAEQLSAIENSPGRSAAVTFTVDTTAPKVTLNPVAKSPSNTTAPTFTGTASDTQPVTVHVYEEPKVGELKEVSKATAAGTGTTWTSAPASPALGAGVHKYTAIATQASSLGNPEGKSPATTFEVDTTSPVLTITSPVSGSTSNGLSPEFSGTASGTHASGAITVRVYEGTPAEGRNVSSTKATVTAAGEWKSTPASPALATGTHTYTAVATEESLLGNPAGTSEVTFTVNTEPPTVTLKSPPSPSNSRTPSFEGTATDTTAVTVTIYEGKTTGGKQVSTVTATPAAGTWVSAPAPPLPTGKHTYTAVAVQPSSLGNPAGKSLAVTFIVDPEAPTVTLNTPAPLTNDTTPSFTGSASNNTPITIRIYEASKTETEVAKASATGTGGAWASGKAAPELRDGQYVAIAEQSSLLGTEHLGRSKEVAFTVDTVPPVVTLSEPADGSSTSGGSQLVTGRAGTGVHDIPRVAVKLFSGSTINEGQAPVQVLEVNAVNGAWSTTFAGLTPGSYTVRAEQRDEAGNLGLSAARTFVVNQPPTAAAVHPPGVPVASFSWFPANPRVGESVSLVSSSTDAGSPLVSFAWDLTGTGAFAVGGPGISTTFTTTGNHVVHLRVADANGLSSVAAETIPVAPPALPLMQPFPIVRITSTGTRSGIRLKQLSVLASRGSKVTVLCRGRRCPLKTQSHMATASRGRSTFVEFKRFERSLAAGVILEIRISKAGQTGKYTRFTVRRGKVPVRSDACLDGLAVKPVVCPSS